MRLKLVVVMVTLLAAACGQQEGVHVEAERLAEGAPVEAAPRTSEPSVMRDEDARDDGKRVPGAAEHPSADADQAHADGLVAFDLYQRQAAPPPTVQTLLDLERCQDAGDLGEWAIEALAPFGEVSGELVSTDLSEVADTTPVLRDPTETPACVVAGRIGDAEVWELRAADGSALARGTASEQLVGAFQRVHERQDRLGGVNFGAASTASGQYVTGVWRGERMELEFSEIEPRRRSLLIVDWPADRPSTPDMEGQLQAEGRAGRLTTATLDLPDYHWPPPVPQRMPAGFVRCAGPAANGGFHSYDTDLCHADGRSIHIRTVNEGVNPVPDPPTRTEVRRDGDRLILEIDTPVEDVTISVPATLGRQTLDAMAATIPLLDRRVWFPAAGRGDELVSEYDDDWWGDTLAEAGAVDVDVRTAAIACPAVAGGEPCPRPGQLRPYEGTATAPDGSRIEFHIYVYDGQPPVHQAPMSASTVTTVGDTDLFITEGYGPDARANCGGVTMTVRPEGVGTTNRTQWDIAPSVDLLSRVLETLAC